MLPIKEFEQLMEELENIEDVCLYDLAKAANEPFLPIDEAFQAIEAHRKGKK